MALSAKDSLELDEVRLIPCHRPPHRGEPELSSQQRLHLLQLAIGSHRGLLVDDRELKRDGPSWTVDTLKDLRRDLGDKHSIVLLMGADAFCSISQWHQWQDLPALAHIGVFLRPGYKLSGEQALVLESLDNKSLSEIHKRPAGCVVAFNQPQIDLSATRIREQLAQGLIPEGLAPAVLDYIIENHLYGFSESFKREIDK